MSKKSTWRLIIIPSAGLLFVVLVWVLVKTYGVGSFITASQAADIAQVKAIETVEATQTKAVEKIEEDGCKPAQKHEKQLGIIEYRLNSIDTKQQELTVEQKAMRTENQTAFKEILKRLPK